MVSKPKASRKKDAMRHYTIHHRAGKHLTFDDREILARDWNDRVERGEKPSLRAFARDHGLALATWTREFGRGKTGESVPDPRNASHRIHATYDPGKAQDAVNEGLANKGAPMKVTNRMAARFAALVREERLSPYDARSRLAEDPEFAGREIPCVRTWYNHIDAGDLPVRHGETPYHPGRRKKSGERPHPARTLPWRLRLDDRPQAADDRLELGHLEMDTVVSSLGGRGGLLTLVDRRSRRLYVEKLGAVSQGEVIRALRRLRKRHELRDVRSVTTDNGCEFLDPDAIKGVLGCDVYYARAYASYEKGSVENANRLVRRWYPKGTDFSLVTRADVRRLEAAINAIHRLSLGGKTASQFDAEERALAA